MEVEVEVEERCGGREGEREVEGEIGEGRWKMEDGRWRREDRRGNEDEDKDEDEDERIPT